VSNFDERSHYVVENKGSAKRTKPNEANFRKAKLETRSSEQATQDSLFDPDPEVGQLPL
jgi:hypothetical protein